RTLDDKPAWSLHPREPSPAAGSATGQPADRFRQLDVPLGHAAPIMGGQAEIDLVPDIGEFRMMVDFLGVHRDTVQEAERLREILEPEAALQRLSVFAQCP